MVLVCCLLSWKGEEGGGRRNAAWTAGIVTRATACETGGVCLVFGPWLGA